MCCITQTALRQTADSSDFQLFWNMRHWNVKDTEPCQVDFVEPQSVVMVCGLRARLQGAVVHVWLVYSQNGCHIYVENPLFKSSTVTTIEIGWQPNKMENDSEGSTLLQDCKTSDLKHGFDFLVKIFEVCGLQQTFHSASVSRLWTNPRCACLWQEDGFILGTFSQSSHSPYTARFTLIVTKVSIMTCLAWCEVSETQHTWIGRCCFVSICQLFFLSALLTNSKKFVHQLSSNLTKAELSLHLYSTVHGLFSFPRIPHLMSATKSMKPVFFEGHKKIPLVCKADLIVSVAPTELLQWKICFSWRHLWGATGFRLCGWTTPAVVDLQQPVCTWRKMSMA